jgi:hypothetical protein
MSITLGEPIASRPRDRAQGHRRPDRQRMFLAAIIATAIGFGAVAPAYANGSGILGNWQAYSKSISPPSIISQVDNADGIYMAGDSISVTTSRELAAILLPSHNLLAVNEWSGRDTAPAVTAIEAMVKTFGRSHRILMATGSNDIFAPEVMSGQIDRLMRIAGPNRKVFWITIYVSRWRYPPAVQLADRQNTTLVNKQIYAAKSRWPNLVIIPWDKWLSAKPTRYAYYLRDGVHTNARGGTFRNTIIRNAILQSH